jgi:hypothetical protein
MPHFSRIPKLLGYSGTRALLGDGYEASGLDDEAERYPLTEVKVAGDEAPQAGT